MMVKEIGVAVVAALEAAGYMGSTIGQYRKSIRVLERLAQKQGGVYTPGLGAEFSAMTTSPRTGKFSAQRRFDYSRLVSVFDSYVFTRTVVLVARKRSGGGNGLKSGEFITLMAAWCYRSRYLTMGPSRSVAADGHESAPPDGDRRGVDRRADAAVVIGDGVFYSLFSVIADWAAERSTMALPAA
ncbi:hypothetical protein [Pseudarthrobacter sp. S9]|uniref:hypothetical protein n=1 Tax=Pseudarthrobacter sp. S9 TaxID=3418421 RepID=UPI003D04A672